MPSTVEDCILEDPASSDEDDFETKIYRAAEKGEWREVLELLGAEKDHSSLLWPTPTEETLRFIQGQVAGCGGIGVTSIGCGTGLLEWLLTSATGLPVKCLEVNKEWWTSKYCKRPFMPLDFADCSSGSELIPNGAETYSWKKSDEEWLESEEAINGCDDSTGSTVKLDKSFALMFCYFNNGKAFREYLRAYTGSCLILVGPCCSDRHCDPEPFDLEGDSVWVLNGSFEMKNRDFVVVYKRKHQSHILNKN